MDTEEKNQPFCVCKQPCLTEPWSAAQVKENLKGATSTLVAWTSAGWSSSLHFIISISQTLNLLLSVTKTFSLFLWGKQKTGMHNGQTQGTYSFYKRKYRTGYKKRGENSLNGKIPHFLACKLCFNIAHQLQLISTAEKCRTGSSLFNTQPFNTQPFNTLFPPRVVLMAKL